MSVRDKLISGTPGFGSAPLGNMFRNMPEEEAATVDAAWQQGIRYFDTAPLYGAGLSEMRLGRALAKHKRGEYVLSSRVGRLILDEVETGPARTRSAEYGRPHPHPGNERPVRGDGSPSRRPCPRSDRAGYQPSIVPATPKIRKLASNI